MLTEFFTSNNWKALSANYTYDNDVNFKNQAIYIDGRMSVSKTPLLSSNYDFKNNNYSLLNISEKVDLKSISDFYVPVEKSDVEVGTISIAKNGSRQFLIFTDQVDDVLIDTTIYDSIVGGSLSSINDDYFFEVDFNDKIYANVSHIYNNEVYYLAVNPTNLNLNFVIASAFDIFRDYNRDFTYFYNKEKNIFTLQIRIRGFAYYVTVNNNRLVLSATPTNSMVSYDSSSVFYLSSFEEPDSPEIMNEWVTYEKTFNQNNLNKDTKNSYLDIKNNYLFHSEYNNIDQDQRALNYNLINLKNQLNQKNEQGKNNIFINQNPTDSRDYISIFAGGNQEQGYDKLHLGYTSYSTPYEFIQGKTTWFHTPQNMYPYKRLNILNTKLVDNGAIAGDNPLRSDKIWKKLANYKSTSNQGDAQEEQTGQWLCSWLSGGNNILSKPVWVDRFYNPKTVTFAQALSSSPTTVTYKSIYDCLNIPGGVVDLPSSLVFEPGCWYAYSRFGKTDIEQNINSLNSKKQFFNFTEFLRSDGSILTPDSEDGVDTFVFNGDRYALVDVDNVDTNYNNFTIMFWGYRDYWDKLAGFQLGGNMTDYGMGIFNYMRVTPFIMLLSGGNFISYNRYFEKTETFINTISSWGSSKFMMRRDPLNSIHIITDKSRVIEFDLRGTIIDATSALSASKPITNVYNDENYGYVLYSNSNVRKINLLSNLVYTTAYNYSIGPALSAKEIRTLKNGNIVIIDGSNSTVVENDIYFLSGGYVNKWSSKTLSYSAVLGPSIRQFNVDKNNLTWTVSGNDNNIAVFGDYSKLLFTTSLSAASSVSTKQPVIKNITFTEDFDNGELVSSVLVTATGSNLNEVILYNLNYSGSEILQKNINTGGTWSSFVEPTNHKFNYTSLLWHYPFNSYIFKSRLYNQFDTEDSILPEIVVPVTAVNTGWHHFAISFNCEEGKLELYLDGEKFGASYFEPNRYNFINLVTDRFTAGATPFYNGIQLQDILDKNQVYKTSYLVTDLKLQNLYFYSRVLNYHDINLFYKQKILPNNLKWNVPSGRRTFVDVASRFFKLSVPGQKSTDYNLYINDSLLDETCQEYIKVSILNKLREITPSYSRVNSIKWLSTLPGLTAQYRDVYFPGNSLTNLTNIVA